MAIWEVVPEPACSLALPPTESQQLPHRGQKGNHPEARHVSAQAGAPLWGPQGDRAQLSSQVRGPHRPGHQAAPAWCAGWGTSWPQGCWDLVQWPCLMQPGSRKGGQQLGCCHSREEALQPGTAGRPWPLVGGAGWLLLAGPLAHVGAGYSQAPSAPPSPWGRQSCAYGTRRPRWAASLRGSELMRPLGCSSPPPG